MSRKQTENKDSNGLLSRIESIEKKLINTAFEEQKLAASASKKASEYRNRTESASKKAEEYLKSIFKNSVIIEGKMKEIESKNVQITDFQDEFIKNKNHATEVLNSLIQTRDSLKNQINHLNEYLEENPDIDKKIEELKKYLANSEEESTKINQILKVIRGRKKEIDDLYFEIIGYDEKVDEESNEQTHIPGLKDELDEAYNELSNNLTEYKKGFVEFQGRTLKDYDKIKLDWEEKYKELELQILKLLPNALTAGLSAAYSAKKKVEEVDLEKLEKSFNRSIGGLVLVSLIPFVVATAMLFRGDSLHDTVLNLPRIILSILPLYIPVLWLAYSANKKMNLSKRLIEEYTHKEVISKTYEGLSTQIERIENNEVSSELRTKLLFNLLSVSSENPGKLISDYNKSDHPIIDALDKSSKLSDAVDRLEKIPGMKKISKILDEKSKKILEKKMDKVDEVLDVLIDEKLNPENL